MYAIIWEDIEGTKHYAVNTKNLRTNNADSSFSTDPKRMAVLTQKKSAEKVIKGLYRDGFEEIMGGRVYYAGVSYSFTEPMIVPKPVEKHGYAICTRAGGYYTGPKSIDPVKYVRNVHFAGNMFNCTVFSTQKKAQKCIDEMIAAIVLDMQRQATVVYKSMYSENLHRLVHDMYTVMK